MSKQIYKPLVYIYSECNYSSTSFFAFVMTNGLQNNFEYTDYCIITAVLHCVFLGIYHQQSTLLWIFLFQKMFLPSLNSPEQEIWYLNWLLAPFNQWATKSHFTLIDKWHPAFFLKFTDSWGSSLLVKKIS